MGREKKEQNEREEERERQRMNGEKETGLSREIQPKKMYMYIIITSLRPLSLIES